MLSKWIVPWLNNKHIPSNFYFHKSWLYFWFLKISTFYRNVYAHFRSIECMQLDNNIYEIYFEKFDSIFLHSLCRITKTSRLAQDSTFRKAFYPLKAGKMWKCVHYFAIIIYRDMFVWILLSSLYHPHSLVSKNTSLRRLWLTHLSILLNISLALLSADSDWGPIMQ